MIDAALVFSLSLTGLLLRSEVVSGWPGLKVDGYTERNKREKPLEVVRMERLEGGVLICLFKGEIGRVEIYLKAETLHFALKKNGSTYYKKLRNPESGETLEPDKIVRLNSDYWRSDRTVNVPALSQLLETSTSAQLALQMVEGAEKSSFVPAETGAGFPNPTLKPLDIDPAKSFVFLNWLVYETQNELIRLQLSFRRA